MLERDSLTTRLNILTFLEVKVLCNTYIFTEDNGQATWKHLLGLIFLLRKVLIEGDTISVSDPE